MEEMETPVSEPAAEQSPEQSSESSQPFEAVAIAQKPQKNRPKIILFSLLGLAILVGVGYGGYRYAMNANRELQSAKPEPAVMTPTPVREQPTPVFTVKDETAGWKTYSLITTRTSIL